MYYGWHSSTRVQIQASVELLLCEVGLSFQPLNEDYATFGNWVMRNWPKTILEIASTFGFEVFLNNTPLQFTRESCEWLMKIFIKLDYRVNKLEILNRVIVQHQVLFLLDIVCAGKRYIEK